MSATFKYFFLGLLLLAFLVVEAQAQSPAYSEDEGTNLWNQESFIEDGNLDEPLGDSGGDYVGQDQVESMEAAALRAGRPGHDIVAALEKDKQLLPDNVMYGLGTGLLMGGWLALLDRSSGRKNAQYLGTGLVFGGLLGVMIGTKSVYQPLMKNASLRPPSTGGYVLSPFLSSSPGHSLDRAGLGLNYRF